MHSVPPDGVPSILSLARLKRWHPCLSDYTKVAAAYPDGVPLTAEAGLALRAAGVDVQWAALRLLTPQGRRDFVLFTLRQRQPHVVSLFRAAGDTATADAIAACKFETWQDARAATPILEAARARASARALDSAWDSAGAAARAAARAAAWDAARASAWDSAWDSAWASATNEQIEWIGARLSADHQSAPERETDA